MEPEKSRSSETRSSDRTTPGHGTPAPLEAGQSIGPYKILELIGEGGMGAVYRALDERLDRIVAIKTLLVRHAAEPDLVQRMHIEARSASALNHPNICTIFDVGEWEGRPYIVMEYLEGESLRERIRGKPLAPDELLRTAIQLAAALEAAHSKRIIHRDVKPANLFLTSSGPVKMMDFGVAKRIRKVAEPELPASPTMTDSIDLTSPGTTVGTVSYMSPEQARGEPLDNRSDLFSAGAVLYEMATGQKPFQGPTVAVVLDAILNRDPAPPSSLNPVLPEDLDRLILKALDKDRSLRYQSAGDMAADLKRLQRDTSTGRLTATSTPLPRESKANRAWIWGALATLVLTAVGVWLWKKEEARDAGDMPRMTMASLRGIKENPVLSPDGERVAFAWTGETGDQNEKQIYVQLAGAAAQLAGPPLQLTRGPGRAETPLWSPDGRQVAYLRVGSAESGYYAVSAMGGLERKLASALDPPKTGNTTFDWSPDGKQLVIADRREKGALPRTLFLIDLSSGSRKDLEINDVFVSNPVFSPDGKMLAFVKGPSFLSHDIWVMPLGGGRAQQLTTDKRWVTGMAWTSNGRNIVFSSRRGGPFSLWTIPASGGAVTPVALSGTDAYSPHIARKSPRLVYVRNKVNKNLWRMKLTDSASAPTEWIASTRTSFQPDYSPDGTRIAFASDRTGAYEVWVSDAGGKTPMQLTTFGGPQTGSPRWSPDGQWIAFDSRPDGHSDIYVVNAAGGGDARRLTQEPSEDRSPFWSADGQWIYFTSNRKNRNNQIWKVPAGGGAAVEVTPGSAIAGAEIDGRIYYSSLNGFFRLDNGASERFAENFPAVGWTARGNNVYWARPDAKGLVEIVVLPLATRRVAVAAKPGHKPSDFDTLTVSPDGQWLLYDRVDQVDNEILIVDNFR